MMTPEVVTNMTPDVLQFLSLEIRYDYSLLVIEIFQ